MTEKVDPYFALSILYSLKDVQVWEESLGIAVKYLSVQHASAKVHLTKELPNLVKLFQFRLLLIFTNFERIICENRKKK